MSNLFHGNLVRLAALDSSHSEAFARWSHNSEYSRLLDTAPARPWGIQQNQDFWEKELEKDQPDLFLFAIHTLAADRLIGFVELDGIQWLHGDCYVGIGLGEPDVWGQGYGTDAMRVILRYAFAELNLQRVTLNVFEYNPRAIRSYEKAGFKHEGRLRQFLHRNGQRWDLIYMGILRAEWEAQQAQQE
jgi:RimJ/RimL family protein N-acetyltransferase